MSDHEKRDMIECYLAREHATRLGAIATMHTAEDQFKFAANQKAHSDAVIDDLLLDLSEIMGMGETVETESHIHLGQE